MAKKNINQIESELRDIIQSDKSNWIRIYELMQEVEQERLWVGIDRSFTAWVRSLAHKLGIHESLLWSRKKAGVIYAEYAKRAADRGESTVSITDLSISPDSLVFCEKIAGGIDSIKDDLISKTIAGDLKRSDLQDAWKTRRAEIESAGGKAAKTNKYTALGTTSDCKSNITAANVISALNSPIWLNGTSIQKYKKNVYRGFPEFAVQTGTSRHARRIDFLVFENFTGNNLAIHGIEIKVSKSDLLNDHKTGEYADFVDYLWFAVPESLLSDAKSVAGDGWGIITIDNNGHAHISVQAVKHDPIMRDHTLQTALIKLL